jgi:hypothetical protein
MQGKWTLLRQRLYEDFRISDEAVVAPSKYLKSSGRALAHV